MSFLSAIRVALGALLVNKGRSVLTSLGIVIGISAVIAMVSAGAGARDKLDERLDSVGKNLILIKPGGRTQQGISTESAPLKEEDVEAIRKKVNPSWLTGVAESQMVPLIMASTRYGNHPVPLVGSVPDLQKIRRWKVKYGRFYTDEDVKAFAPVCLIGENTRQKLFPDKPDPVGESVRVGRIQLRVIGVLGEKGRSPTGADQDDQIFLPVTTLRHKLTGRDRIDLIITCTRSEELIERAKEEIIRVMRESHHIKPGSSDDFDVSTVQEMAELAVVLTKTMQILIAVIASISLIVGGIGIMNIMLVSVTERTREIGIRMAIGATPWDILIQFLIEAVVLALVGGIIGISLGLGGAFALAEVAGWPPVLQPNIVLLAFFVSAAVGIFFGFYPAQKASRLDPIEALRYE
jgi:putative ABC transport system permease protein